MKPFVGLLTVLLLGACSPSVVEQGVDATHFTPLDHTATPAALVTLVPANTLTPLSPTSVALTPTPLPTPTDSPPPPTPALPEIEGQTDVELGIAWGVPQGWHDLDLSLIHI